VVQAGLDASVELRSAEITNTEMISNNRKKGLQSDFDLYDDVTAKRERKKVTLHKNLH
jgi:hypothetical protein